MNRRVVAAASAGLLLALLPAIAVADDPPGPTSSGPAQTVLGDPDDLPEPGPDPSNPAALTAEPDPLTGEPAPAGPTSAVQHTAKARTQSSAQAAAPMEYTTRFKVIGNSQVGRKIYAFYRGWTNLPPTARTLVVVGQMHGDEKAGLQTAEWLRRYHTPKKGAQMWVIITMNPDGNARNTRVNARGVDLNRNWQTSGWRRTAKGSTYSGPTWKSEVETRVMQQFLDWIKPDYIASIHQPYGVVAQNGQNPAYEKRLSANLGLPLRPVGVGNPAGTTSPTLTGYYNKKWGAHGAAVTIEYQANAPNWWAQAPAGQAITGAALIRP